MPKSTTFSNDLVALVFNGTAISFIADNAASIPLTQLYVSLHTATPGVGGSQTANEATYGDYSRVGVPRGNTGWTVSSGAASNAALIQLPQCNGGSNTITHVAIGTSLTGAGKVLYQGQLNSSLSVTNLIQPQFAINALTTTES